MQIFAKIAISLLKESIYEVPSYESAKFADEHKDGRRNEFGAVEAESYGDNITDERYPREQC